MWWLAHSVAVRQHHRCLLPPSPLPLTTAHLQLLTRSLRLRLLLLLSLISTLALVCPPDAVRAGLLAASMLHLMMLSYSQSARPCVLTRWWRERALLWLLVSLLAGRSTMGFSSSARGGESLACTFLPAQGCASTC